MADQATLRIRKATEADANEIARIHTVSRQSIYRGHFSDDYLDNIDVDQRSSTWRKLASRASDELVVGEVSSLMVGFLHLTKSRDADAIESTDEVSAIYLDPAFWRMRTLSFAVRAYQVLKEATLMRVFQALREDKIVFTQPRPIPVIRLARIRV